MLAAAPATQVQLAHACLAAGYQAIIPATWGDELIAARAVESLGRTNTPIVQCSCPLVASRLSAHGDIIAPMVFFCVAPPVATATYLRAVYTPTVLKITFAGGCPSASHASIDLWLSVEQLFSALADRGIDVGLQPTEFDSVLPPDRRRFYSEPGGIPTSHALNRLSPPVELIELTTQDFAVDLAQQLLASSPALIDVAPALGCSCSGSVNNVSARLARARVREQEPPRALSPVVDHALAIELQSGLSKVPGAPAALADHPRIAPASPLATPAAEPEVIATAVETPRRRSPSGPSRAVLGTMPQARSSGRQLPRAYVARRRSSPKGVRASLVRRQISDKRVDPRLRWLLIGGVGVTLGLGLAWLLRLVF